MNIFKKIGMLFKSEVSKFFTKVLDEVKGQEHLIHNAAAITYNIYTYVEQPNPVLSAIETVVSTVDPLLLPMVTQSLKNIAANFSAFDDDVKNATDANDLLKRIATTFKTLDANTFAFLAHNFSSLLAKVFTPQTTLGQIFAVIESVWQGFTKPELLSAPTH